MILMAFFCTTKRFKVDFHVQSLAFDELKPRPNDRNIVGCNMLRAFGHSFAMCCDMLGHVGYCWLKFENGQIFHA